MAAEVKTVLEGKWTVDRSDNFEAFLDKKGIGMIKKKVVLSATATMVIQVQGETLTVTNSVGPKSVTKSFKLDGESELDDDGKPSKAVSTWSEGKLTIVVTPNDPKSKPTTLIREIINGELVQTMTFDGVTCKRFFKKSK